MGVSGCRQCAVGQGRYMAESGIHERNKVRLFTRRNALAALMDREDEVKTRAGSARDSPPFSGGFHFSSTLLPHLTCTHRTATAPAAASENQRVAGPVAAPSGSAAAHSSTCDGRRGNGVDARGSGGSLHGSASRAAR